jgi:hypothetical protein
MINFLHTYIKIESDNSKKFNLVLQKFLYEISCYSVDVHFEHKKINTFIYDLDCYLNVYYTKSIRMYVPVYFIC